MAAVRRIPLLLLLLSFLWSAGCRSGRSDLRSRATSPDPRWAMVDSLMREGRYADALTATDGLLAESRGSGDALLQFTAHMRRAYLRQLTGTARLQVLQDLDRTTDSLTATGAPLPLVPLLHSALAEAWWNAYSDDRWRVLERGRTADDPADPETWSQSTYMQHILRHVHRSLEPLDSLKAFATADLGGLLRTVPTARGVQTPGALALRPTLFDLLGHRALDLLRNPETRLAEPADAFQLNDPRHFALFDDFVFKPFVHADTGAWGLMAMRLHQRLERAHMSDDRPDALVDATLERLAHVRAHSTLPHADSLYLNALLTLRTRVPEDSCWSEVTLAMAQWHADRADRYDPLVSEAHRDERRTALALCDEAMARFPGSTGARNAAVLRAQLLDHELDLRSEEAAMPGRELLLSLRYRNTPQVWLRVVKDPQEPGRDRRWQRDHQEWLLQQRPVRSWTLALPDDGDLNPHRVDLPVDGLPAGRYAILVSDSARFAAGKDRIAFTHVQVTRFALAQRSAGPDQEVLVMDRWTGEPLPGVKVSLYGDRSGSDQPVKLGEAVTDVDGRPQPAFNPANGRQVLVLEQGDDRWMADAGYRWWNGDPPVVDSLRTFLFTDRAIYRPGQEIHVKGIVTVKQGDEVMVRAGHRGVLHLHDVNGEVVDTVPFTTDAYGAVVARFIAPTGALTGVMRIEEEHGSTQLRVEEYKRPTFEVRFDPLAGQPRLNDEVELTGTATSYAGVPLDGATVRWTVQRTPRMPWWCGFGWRGLPWGRATQVATGTATCDAQGRFIARFIAPADPAFPRDADPTFHFAVEAVVTDRSGEPQQGSTTFDLAHRRITLDLRLGEAVDRSALDSIDLRVRNLNGQEVDVPVDVRIQRLQAPARPFRERLLPRPDRPLLDRAAHEQRFPDDAYGDAADPLTWPVAEAVYARSGHRASGRALLLPDARSWDVGTYRIDLLARDEGGDTVRVRSVVTLYDPAVQHTGFAGEAFHVEVVKGRCEPGEKAVLLLSSALPDARVLMEVERDGVKAVSRRLTLSRGQQRVELPVREDDRGGFAVHLLCVERGRVHARTVPIDVPWTNKDLEVEWMSFRDKLQPGDREEWRLKLRGAKGNAVAAQLLAAMYDASLDHFVPHDWVMDVHPRHDARLGWQRTTPFGTSGGVEVWRPFSPPPGAVRVYPQLETHGFTGHHGWADAMDVVVRGARSESTYSYVDGIRVDQAELKEVEMVTSGVPANYGDVSGGVIEQKGEEAPKDTDPREERPADAPPPLRSDLRETAFFLPDLLTDRDGSVVLRFTVPDALTRWNLLGLAHTPDLQLAKLARSVRTVKPLMVVPNLPRFLRAGDRMVLTAKVNVTEPGRAEGLAALALYDPATNALLNTAFGLGASEQVFIASQGESAVVSWSIVVPEGVGAVGVRITATARPGPQSTVVAADGEERVLPVLTDQVLVTERLPLWMKGPGTRTFTLNKLFTATPDDRTSTRRNHLLRLQYTPNPAWLAVQALPYLMEFPHECAEQLFSRYYANRLAAHVVAQRPAIRSVFERWRQAGPDAFASALERNADLKQALLAETPWVVDARDDRTRRQRIAQLFDLDRMAREEDEAMRRLQQMQLPTGAWPWWAGMPPSRWVTQHVVAGMGHLDRVGAADPRADGPVQRMLGRAVIWLDGEVLREHRRRQRELDKDALAAFRPDHGDLHYLYARSFFRRIALDGAAGAAAQWLLDRAADGWQGYGLHDQALLALVLHRFDRHIDAARIVESLRQRAVQSDELGMYWSDFRRGVDPWGFPAETHARMIEAFHEVAGDAASVNALRLHLLQLKRTTDWGTTTATAEACHALLLTGDAWLEEGEGPEIRVGGQVVGAQHREAGTGTFERTWSGEDVKPALGEVTITERADRPSWGALYWQYFERMDRVTPPDLGGGSSPFQLTRQVMLERPGDRGPELVELGQGVAVRPGDKLVLRLVLRTDRPLDFVHVKDLRAAGLEPVDALSGYRVQSGLGHYQSIRDAAMDLFVDRLPAGTHVFSYAVRATHAGDFSQGIASATCMYAPEFGGHSEGLRVLVSE
ncbi:MAG TPA: alpha-2-macroglobulin family protein [Flavobacteriales bacterium]|nr:alpha-2-macroglobulin family protein [Flavobacteriales bacterium]HMR26191.1 alpha-2-macroglobulin family protein [Flavobacteriales bacterium]